MLNQKLFYTYIMSILSTQLLLTSDTNLLANSYLGEQRAQNIKVLLYSLTNNSDKSPAEGMTLSHLSARTALLLSPKLC